MPAARATEMTAHGGTIGPVVTGISAKVYIGYKPAARVSDTTECKGPPGTIALGEFTVMMGG